MAEVRTFGELQLTSSEIRVRKIHMRDLWQSLKEGYDDFNAKPSFGLFLIIIYPLFALLLTLVSVGENLLPLVFPLIAGFTLLGPMGSVALFEMSRRRERGLDLRWRSAFDFVHTYSFAPILALSVLIMLLYVAWLFMARFIYFGLFDADVAMSISEFATRLVTTRQGAGLIMYGMGVGLMFAFTTLAISVVAFPLLLDRPVSTGTAIAVSVRAVTSNLFVMAVWGLIVVALLIVGSILFLVGLAVLLPILGHATWHVYRKVVEPGV